MLDLNIERINAQRETIQENLQRLETLRGRSYQALIDDPQALAAAKYWLQTAIQAMIDITSHICARLRIATQPDSGECIRALQTRGVFARERATVYSRMIRFRNVLVHLYGEVDNRRVHNIIENELDYFRMFLMDIDTFIESEAKKQQKQVKKKKR